MPETIAAPRRQSTATTGACLACGAELGKVAMRNHLLGKCPGEPAGAKERFLIAVSGLPAARYWLYVDAAPSATLADLDSILRDAWLDCCGHLSAFTIAGREYESDPEGGGRGMAVPLRKVLEPGLEFGHEYDFGSTTYLSLRVVGLRKVETAPAGAHVAARNLPPAFACGCGNPATQICTECAWNCEGLFCDICLEGADHDCGEDFALPLANSPRVGVCGYSGD